ncbi:MAG: PadR family transcriptional regulator [Actinobacteria bacterium]|nr:PadR family transcriptional regulator [Actinomycetota bacterium]MCG2818520.1 PadR family transcriptional regulator [Actinomycetes bacterium]MBU4179519.1 PadR family transcriptional regulator [Actinomycetota bacterium]MBU4218291.1 PadR family transcriptional regulator [Actinomycetota bacterium]MBU4358716.1 PadR family transcriptional regulator [Actinomycetota bacterium]
MLDLAILGLLKEKPMHGYELKKRLSYMLGHFWSVSYGSLYPAMKRLEKSGSIERAYSVKEKTRHRNVYRITPAGNEKFMALLADKVSKDSLADTDKFDIRMAFFQYLDPETRLVLLERRRTCLEEQVDSFKAYRKSNKETDRYRTGLLRHKVELTMSDIRWVGRLIDQERETIRKRDGVSPGKNVEPEDEKEQVPAASSA